MRPIRQLSSDEAPLSASSECSNVTGSIISGTRQRRSAVATTPTTDETNSTQTAQTAITTTTTTSQHRPTTNTTTTQPRTTTTTITTIMQQSQQHSSRSALADGCPDRGQCAFRAAATTKATTRATTTKTTISNDQFKSPTKQPATVSGSGSNHNTLWRALLVGGALLLVLLAAGGGASGARVTFEKMTNRDYSGTTYYSIQNVSLFECLGWCKEESSCTSAAFSFVVNPFAALQETTCMLQNDTLARKVVNQYSSQSALATLPQPQKATNLYFFNKIHVRSEHTCNRLWAAERFPNKRLRVHSNQLFGNVPSKEICLGYCMGHTEFVCRSFEYNYMTQQCFLSEHDRRSPYILHQVQLAQQQLATSGGSALLAAQQQQAVQDLQDAPGVDYYENACLLSEDICPDARIYDYAKIGLPHQRVAHFVELNYYPDKEMLVKSQAGCVRACTIEHEFICRSIVYRSSNKQGQPNCALYHLDQKTFPDGADTFASQVMQPLLDSGETSAVYLEAMCANETLVSPSSSQQQQQQSTSSSTAPQSIGGNNGGGHPPSSIQIPITSTTNNQNINIITDSTRPFPQSLPNVTPPGTIQIQLNDRPSSGSGAGSSTMNPGRLPSTPSNIQLISTASSTVSPIITSMLPMREDTNDLPMPNGMPIRQPGGGGQIVSSGNNQGNGNTLINPVMDQNCDAHGYCYDVSLKCTDTKIVVNVKTEKPFHGRIYALGRSETCNAHIKNQQQFQLEMFLTGQDCNTQSGSGIYTNTIVLQHHNVVLTKADKVYHVRCTYETASRNVSFGMMPVRDNFDADMRDPETIHITSSPDAPLPKITILTADGREASTVRIGDRLTFRIEIPENTPYGIFARSCVAMAKDARSTFEIIDENGCPVDHTIFPNFMQINNALESNYEAFRFTESYGVIFQCNVKYCIGKCEPVICNIGGREQVEAWGRKRRSVDANDTGNDNGNGNSAGNSTKFDDMTLSREIVVLDMKEGQAANPSAPKSLRLPENKARYNGLQTHCVTGTTMIALIIAVSLLFILYVCTIAYFTTRRHTRISPIKASSNYH